MIFHMLKSNSKGKYDKYITIKLMINSPNSYLHNSLIAFTRNPKFIVIVNTIVLVVPLYFSLFFWLSTSYQSMYQLGSQLQFLYMWYIR